MKTQEQIRKAIEQNKPNVAVGQVWRDCDKRMYGRRVTIQSVDGDFAIARDRGGRTVKIRIDRLRPTSTGFALESA